MSHLSVSDAQAIVLRHVQPGAVETVALECSLGRVLAEDIFANRDLPPWDVSAMDGYALRSADLGSLPAILTVVDDIKAGDLPHKHVGEGEAARIMTGAPVPPGADAVIRVEDTQALAADRVQVDKAVRCGNDIRPRGEGMTQGQIVLTAGSEITPGTVGLLATVKAAQVPVYARPRVAILATGDELEGLEEPFDPDRIPNSNSYALMAQCQALGIEPVLLGIARDDRDELEQYLRRGLQFDVLLVSGGSSVGVHDHVRPTLEALGVSIHFWRVAMRPGHPLLFGSQENGGVVYGLPGNPVSSFVTFLMLVRPFLLRLQGAEHVTPRALYAPANFDLNKPDARREFLRVRLNEQGALELFGNQSSGVLTSAVWGDGLADNPAMNIVKKGDVVRFIPMSELLQ